MHGVHRAAGQARGDGGEQRGQREAEADLLALHVAASRVDARRMQHGRAGRLGPVGDRHAADEDDGHRGEDRPGLAGIADQPAEGEDDGRGEHEHLPDLEGAGERGRVLEGMRSIGVEEAAAVGAQQLDGDLRGDGPDRERPALRLPAVVASAAACRVCGMPSATMSSAATKESGSSR